MDALLDASLAEELLVMEREAQRLRSACAGALDAAAADQAVREADARHTARLKEIVAVRGWPGRSIVGWAGAQAAWMLALHADDDLPFQKDCLARLWEAFGRGEADGIGPATLEDCVRVAQGRKQLYGTLCAEGSGAPLPIEDESGVDERRIKVGLPLLAEQLRLMQPIIPADPALREELLRMEEEDQRLRGQWSRGPMEESVVEKTRAVDRRNTARMKEIVSAHGWLGGPLVGRDGAQAAWLLVQHADHDPAFQEHCLALMRAAHEKGDCSGQDLAYLEDRVRVNTGRKQLYGTQCAERDGRLEPSPIEDESGVDERRARVGLQPLAQYLDRMRRQYGP